MHTNCDLLLPFHIHIWLVNVLNTNDHPQQARKSKSSIPIASESAEVINLRNTLKKSRSLLDTSNNSDASRGLLAPSRSIMGTYRKNRKKAPSWSPGKAEGGKPPKVMSDCNAFSEFQDEYPDSATKSWRGRMSRLTLKKGKSSPQLRDDAMKQQTAALSSQQHRHTYSIMGWVRGHNKDPLPQTESDNESALPQSTTNGTGPMIGYPLDKYFAELFQQDLAEPEPLFAVGSATVISETPSVEMPGQGTDELQRQRILQLATSAFGCENWESFETLFDETFLKLKLELDKDEVLYR
ncbi:hypothetical protein SARC_02290 [Sphaeroforma arctica JP610]|uniref:Uncharacterized protein n=1 Tax=Sphaeroforma arctica JP610 TaxID=667725 RepID=A0A0L0G9E0_9EUKA|nr:hypothetical protein SARC_02290 [Sphaeroforma arctica JP610]KNC85529.1 hypothetical protein SARC_02290 [Sphaeroforma arctica JP610]|eukprot:XP_014159431.1 hypothetical protein SARC_02290 [Sphaeroforma arctica JP610]